MNYQYDLDSSRLCLDAYLQSAAQDPHIAPLVTTLPLGDCAVVQFDNPPSLRLVRTGPDGELDEVAVTVPGIICSKVLPPVYGPLRSHDPEHVRRLRQFVRLTGLGSHTFGGMAPTFEGVVGAFRNVTGFDRLEPFEFGEYEGQYCVDMHARHLTERRFAGSEPHIPFPAEIDPNHVLDEARDTRFIRIQDNVVQYSNRKTLDDGTSYFESAPPVMFKEGDIVEATGAFVAYPVGGGGPAERHYKLVFALRALTMLNSQFREESKIDRKVDIKRLRKDDRPKRARYPSTTSLRRHYVPVGEPR